MAAYDYMILGAGAVGCVFGGLLSRSGFRVQLINRSTHTAEAITEKGLRLELDEELITVHPDAAALDGAASARFVFCFTKSFQTRAALEAVLDKLDPESVLISLQNGLGNGALLAETAPGRPVLHGVTMAPATLLGPAHVRSHGAHASWVGPFRTDESGQREKDMAAQAVRDLQKSGLKIEYTDDPLIPIWRKACFNLAMNGVSALADASPGLIGDTRALREEVHELADEAVAVARALGVGVEAEKVHDMIDFACAEHRFHQPSMLQDIRAGRPTEIDALNGYLIKQAKQLGLKAPRNRLINALVRARQAAPAFWAQMNKTPAP